MKKPEISLLYGNFRFFSVLDDVQIFFVCQLAQLHITQQLVFADVTQFVFFLQDFVHLTCLLPGLPVPGQKVPA